MIPKDEMNYMIQRVSAQIRQYMHFALLTVGDDE